MYGGKSLSNSEKKPLKGTYIYINNGVILKGTQIKGETSLYMPMQYTDIFKVVKNENFQ